MKIDQIIELWSEDVKIDNTDLGEEALKIPKIHNKYYQLFIREKLLLRKYENDFKVLKMDKYEFYTQGPNEDTPPTWKLPPIGRILKNDVSNYIEADKDIIAMSLKIGYQSEKVDFLKAIIESLKNRGFLINNAIKWAMFQVGV